MFFGKEMLKGGDVWASALTDLNVREKMTLFPLAAIALVMGLAPSLVLTHINDSVLAFVDFTRHFIR
jgi:NADH-quinone oxidoreductase subunit M